MRTTRASAAATIADMPVLTSGNTVYTHPVAKVMISIPDALLERVDAHTRAARESRSGFLQRLAERELEAADAHMRDEVERLLDEIDIQAPPDDPAKGDIARLIREDRESH